MSRDVARLEVEWRAMLHSYFAHPVDARYRRLRRRAYGRGWVVLAGSYLHAGRTGATVRCLANAAATHPPSLAYAARLPDRRRRNRS